MSRQSTINFHKIHLKSAFLAKKPYKIKFSCLQIRMIAKNEGKKSLEYVDKMIKSSSSIWNNLPIRMSHWHQQMVDGAEL